MLSVGQSLESEDSTIGTREGDAVTAPVDFNPRRCRVKKMTNPKMAMAQEAVEVMLRVRYHRIRNQP